MSWHLAKQDCVNLAVGNRKGWRLPSVTELSSLMELFGRAPTMPIRSDALRVALAASLTGRGRWLGHFLHFEPRHMSYDPGVRAEVYEDVNDFCAKKQQRSRLSI